MSKCTQILIVDDDPEFARLLATYLQAQGFLTAVAGNGDEVDAYLEHNRADLVILDVMLPREDGISVARRLRARGDCAIIMVSGRGDEVDRIVGLEVGADDYLVKPCSPRELLARIRAVLRRHPAYSIAPTEPHAHVARFGPYRLDLQAHILTRDGEEISLTAGDFALLRIFIEHANRVLHRDRLLHLLNGYERSPFDRSVDVRVNRLRRKIEDDPASPRYVRTMWGVGYLFCPCGDEPERNGGDIEGGSATERQRG